MTKLIQKIHYHSQKTVVKIKLKFLQHCGTDNQNPAVNFNKTFLTEGWGKVEKLAQIHNKSIGVEILIFEGHFLQPPTGYNPQYESYRFGNIWTLNGNL